MKRLALLLLCFLACPAGAKEAVYANGILTFDTVKVGNDTFEAQLAPVPGSNPLAFIVTSARQIAPANNHAATFAGTSLTVPDVLVNNTERLSANLTLVGENPLKFQLNSYTVIRAVALEDFDQPLKQGRLFFVNYTGSVLDSSKVKLNIGDMTLPGSVVKNSIAAVVPVGMTGTQMLNIELDGATFQLPLAVDASENIANPKVYVSDFVSNISRGLQSLGLPAGVLDNNAITNQLNALSETEAKQVALQIRENFTVLESIERDVFALQQNIHALSAFTPTTSLSDCQRWMVYYLRTTSVVALGSGMAAGGLLAASTGALTGVMAITTAISVSSGIIAGEMAADYQDRLLSYDCRQVFSASVRRVDPLRSEVLAPETIIAYDNRAVTVQIEDLYQLADTQVRTDFLSASVALRSAISSMATLLTKFGALLPSAAMTAVNDLLVRIKTDDTARISDTAHKFVVRSVSNPLIRGSVVATKLGMLTLKFDKTDEVMVPSKNVTFLVELYNSADDVSITVAVKLNGDSMLEDLKLAVLGNWIVYRIETDTIYTMELLAGGTGFYLLPKERDASCPNGVARSAFMCEYRINWFIRTVTDTKNGDQYYLQEEGFWHPGFSGLNRSPLTLPLFRFETGEPGAPVVRYTKY